MSAAAPPLYRFDGVVAKYPNYFLKIVDGYIIVVSHGTQI